MRLHVNALFTHNDDGDLVAVNTLDRGAAPRFFIGRTEQGTLLRFRYDVDIEIRRQLEMVVSRIGQFENLNAADFEAVLSESAPLQRTWRGPVYVCENVIDPVPAAVQITDRNADLLSPFLEAWRPDAQRGDLMFAVVIDDRAVAVCGSVRVTPLAHEAGVETAREYRSRGYAARAVAAWANAVIRAGCVPLYSTSWHNESSRSVAGKLGLRRIGTDLHFT